MSARETVIPSHFGTTSIASDLDTTEHITLSTRFAIMTGRIHNDISDAQRLDFRKAARGTNSDGIERWHKEGGRNVHGGSKVAFPKFLEDMHETIRLEKLPDGVHVNGTPSPVIPRKRTARYVGHDVDLNVTEAVEVDEDTRAEETEVTARLLFQDDDIDELSIIGEPPSKRSRNKPVITPSASTQPDVDEDLKALDENTFETISGATERRKEGPGTSTKAAENSSHGRSLPPDVHGSQSPPPSTTAEDGKVLPRDIANPPTPSYDPDQSASRNYRLALEENIQRLERVNTNLSLRVSYLQDSLQHARTELSTKARDHDQQLADIRTEKDDQIACAGKEIAELTNRAAALEHTLARLEQATDSPAHVEEHVIVKIKTHLDTITSQDRVIDRLLNHVDALTNDRNALNESRENERLRHARLLEEYKTQCEGLEERVRVVEKDAKDRHSRHTGHLSAACLQFSRAEDDILDVLASLDIGTQHGRALKDAADKLHEYHSRTRALAMTPYTDNITRDDARF
ncbi:hypothetical protein PLICRDRAFT_27489 [Plicaturopsis crispa FD-325 SS-3]|nr:hypothetical protein PLICRDRAFT_27489 [Plicaturopsis crispa FD-325 SS-3]